MGDPEIREGLGGMIRLSPVRSGELRLGDVPEIFLTSDIRVKLDRSALVRLDPEVRVVVARTEVLADRIYSPWYEVNGLRVAYDDPSAVPMTIAELANHEDQPSRFPISPLVLPCYALPEGDLCLDGNHRLSAALQFNPGLTVVLFSIQGPLDRAILPDLRFWESRHRAT